MTYPTCRFWQTCVRTIGAMSIDQRQPGSQTKRPIVVSSRLTMSIRPCGNVRTWSGLEKLLRWRRGMAAILLAATVRCLAFVDPSIRAIVKRHLAGDVRLRTSSIASAIRSHDSSPASCGSSLPSATSLGEVRRGPDRTARHR